MADIPAIGEMVERRLATVNAAREQALDEARQIIRLSANSIRAVHRGEHDGARQLADQAGVLVASQRQALAAHPMLYWSGYVQDAQKEYTEARATAAVIGGSELPTPDSLGVEDAPYLNGLGETVGELRRYVLDIIREGNVERGEHILAIMDEIYTLLVTIDYPDAITAGLRRTADNTRAILERTRGDLTITLRQAALEQALRATQT